MISPSEFQSVVKGKRSDIGQPKTTNCSSALSPFMPEHEFSELLWENGHVVLQGQSNRPKSSSFPAPFPSPSGKTREKEAKDAVIPKVGRHQAAGSVRNDFQTPGASGQIGLNGQDDELVPWLNYPIDDYYSELFSEFSGVNMNYVSTVVPTDGVSSFGQAATDAHGLGNGDGNRDLAGSSKSSKIRNSQLLKLQQQCQSFSPSSRLKEVDLSIGTAYQGPSGDLSPAIVLKQELTASKQVQPNSSTPLMNFSHFSKPVAFAKANLQSVDRVRGGEKASNVASGNLMESPLVESTGGLRSVSVFHRQLTSVTVKADLNPPVHFSQEMAFVENSDAICRKDAAKNSRNSNRTATSNNEKSPDHMEYQNPDVKATEKCETAKCGERVIASTSMCSVNGTGVESNDVKNTVKRKFKESEESEYPSEQDHEDDSTGIRKPITGQTSSKKRSRAAEVHNLSERRRRDRINEKMRALQELIPNCNKVDKASMLDEAIEYLKTLQMQVQIMSMGSGLYIPQMMLSTGIQHIHAPHLGSFSPMGVGMGICTGLGFGMGMLDMAGSPLMPIPHMHGSQYPHAPIPVTAGPHGMVGSTNPQVFGMPGQAVPMSMPHPPPFIHLTGVSANVNLVPEAPVAEVSPVQTPGSAPPNLEDQQLNILEQIAKPSTGNTKAESSGQAIKECFELQPVVQIDNQPLDVGCCEAINSGNCIHLPP